MSHIVRAGFGNRIIRFRRLHQLLKLGNRQAGSTDDFSHRVGVHRIAPRDRDDPRTVGHRDVLSLPGDLKAGLPQRAYRPLMRDAGQLGHD